MRVADRFQRPATVLTIVALLVLMTIACQGGMEMFVPVGMVCTFMLVVVLSRIVAPPALPVGAVPAHRLRPRRGPPEAEAFGPPIRTLTGSLRI